MLVNTTHYENKSRATQTWYWSWLFGVGIVASPDYVKGNEFITLFFLSRWLKCWGHRVSGSWRLGVGIPCIFFPLSLSWHFHHHVLPTGGLSTCIHHQLLQFFFSLKKRNSLFLFVTRLYNRTRQYTVLKPPAAAPPPSPPQNSSSSSSSSSSSVPVWISSPGHGPAGLYKDRGDLNAIMRAFIPRGCRLVHWHSRGVWAREPWQSSATARWKCAYVRNKRLCHSLFGLVVVVTKDKTRNAKKAGPLLAI